MPSSNFDVTGMACGGCESNVTDALSAIEGVTAVDADHETDRVTVEHDDGVSPDALTDAIVDAGYEVA